MKGYKNIFLCEDNILYHRQFGSQEWQSTKLTTINLTDQIIDSFENKSFGLGVFIELPKTFDTVHHKILIAKSKNYGVTGNNFFLFQSFLESRKPYLKKPVKVPPRQK